MVWLTSFVWWKCFHDFRKLSQTLPLVWISHILCMYLYYKVFLHLGKPLVFIYIVVLCTNFCFLLYLLTHSGNEALPLLGLWKQQGFDWGQILTTQVEKCDLDKWWLALPIGANKTILPEPTQSTESLTVVTSAAKIFVEKKLKVRVKLFITVTRICQKRRGWKHLKQDMVKNSGTWSTWSLPYGTVVEDKCGRNLSAAFNVKP